MLISTVLLSPWLIGRSCESYHGTVLHCTALYCTGVFNDVRAISRLGAANCFMMIHGRARGAEGWLYTRLAAAIYWHLSGMLRVVCTIQAEGGGRRHGCFQDLEMYSL